MSTAVENGVAPQWEQAGGVCFRVPLALLLDPTVGRLAKLLWSVLDLSAQPSQKELMTLLNCSCRGLQVSLDELAEAGWITVLHRSNGKRNRYVTLTGRVPKLVDEVLWDSIRGGKPRQPEERLHPAVYGGWKPYGWPRR